MSNINSIPELSMMTIQEYLTERKMSGNSVILTEGKDDSIFFQLLKSYFQRKLSVDLSIFEIETVELIKSDENDQLGNREKVEYLCELADQDGLPIDSLKGFVDRELRGFDFSSGYLNHYDGHQEIGRCIWSKGHSIENYLFRIDILKNVFFEMGVSSRYDIDDLIIFYSESYPELMKSALLISVASKESGSLKKSASCIIEDVFPIENNGIFFDFEKFSLCLKQRVDDESFLKFEEIINGDKVFLEAGCEEMAWALHGHIGIRMIYFSFMSLMNDFFRSNNMSRYKIISIDEFFKKLSLAFFDLERINLEFFPGRCFKCHA